jgi:drug/metabolite transporter (DMT)-like permease
MPASNGQPGGTGPSAMGSVEWALLAALSVLWGGSFFFGKVALADLPPITVVLGRVAVAAIALNIVVAARGLRMPPPAAWGPFVAMGTLNNLIPFGLIFWGQTRIDSGKASILNATSPLFTVLLVRWLTDEHRLPRRRMVGIGVGFVGTVVVLGPETVGGTGGQTLGGLAVLAAALSYGFAKIYGRRFRDTPAAIAACGQVSATALLALPLACIVDRPWTLARPGGATVAAVVGLGLLSTALAYTIYFRLLAAAGPTNLSLVTYLVPVTAVILGVLFLGETLSGRIVAGTAIVFAGLAVVDGRPLTRLRSILQGRARRDLQ